MKKYEELKIRVLGWEEEIISTTYSNVETGKDNFSTDNDNKTPIIPFSN